MPIETRQQYLERVVKEQAEEIKHLKKEIDYLMLDDVTQEGWSS